MIAKYTTAPVPKRNRPSARGRPRTRAQATATRSGTIRATGPLQIVPSPAAAKNRAAGRTRRDSDSSASNAARTATVMQKVSIMSKMTIRPNTMNSGDSASVSPASHAPVSPSRERANVKTRTIVARANRADGARADSSPTPKSEYESATAQKKAGGLSRYTTPSMCGVTQSPLSSISRAASAFRPSSGSPSPGRPSLKKKIGAHTTRSRTIGKMTRVRASRGAGGRAAAEGTLMGRRRIGAPRDRVNGHCGSAGSRIIVRKRAGRGSDLDEGGSWLSRDVSFPIFLRSRDDTHVSRFDSLEGLRRSLEAIDVENEEFEAWDDRGFRVRLLLLDSLEIGAESSEDRPAIQEALRAFTEFASAEAVTPTLPPMGESL